MSEGNSGLSPASQKRKKLEKKIRCRNIMMNRKTKSEREIEGDCGSCVGGSGRTQKMCALAKTAYEVYGREFDGSGADQKGCKKGYEGLKNLKIMMFEQRKEMKKREKMKKKKKKMMIKLKVEEEEEEDKKNEGEGVAAAKHEEERGESDDDASSADLKQEDEKEAIGVDGGDDEHDEYSTDTENEALRLREYIKQELPISREQS